MMIPKIIHYCWFGNGELPEKVKYCINSWKEILPDFELKLWNESNFDINHNRFTKEAYETKNYAFVSDYVRLYALSKYGGIYLDVDVEIIKEIDLFLNHSAFLGFEEPAGGVASCIMGSKKNHDFINYMLKKYNQMVFINVDGSHNKKPNTLLLEDALKEYYESDLSGQYHCFKDGLCIYPFDFFHPLSLISGKINKTKNTYAIHHHTLLWVSMNTKIIKFLRLNFLVPVIGETRYLSLMKKVKKHINLK
jgi:mannosyltransferase OCH1-like enzyme